MARYTMLLPCSTEGEWRGFIEKFIRPFDNRCMLRAGKLAGQLIFGIVICNDSNYPDLTRCMSARGATALFIPTNNGLPNGRISLELKAAARAADIARATEPDLRDPRRRRRAERQSDISRVFRDSQSRRKCSAGSPPWALFSGLPVRWSECPLSCPVLPSFRVEP
jgi:hypothetical protein